MNNTDNFEDLENDVKPEGPADPIIFTEEASENDELITGTPTPRTEEEILAIMKEADEAKLRALAEVDNMRKRLQREKEESIRYAASKVLADILPALDNLDLALEHAKNDEACKNFFIGVDMTKKLMIDSLAKHGLQVVGNIGEEFDPNIHEAVGMEANADVAEGAVCGLLSKGYKLHERLLRPARVIVCKNS